MAQVATGVSDVRNQLLEETQKKADETNKTRAGKGTRIRVGQTRGKNPKVITWEAFDDSQPDTLPSSVQEFLELTKTTDEKVYLSYLIDGFNSAQYTAASDPIAEFVNPAWPDEIQKNFRMAVNNYAKATNTSIEDAVNLIKPGIEASQAKK